MREEVIGDCRSVWIYALCEPGGHNPRYVGKTHRSLSARHKGHLYDVKRRSHLPLYRWIKKQHAKGVWTCIRALEIVAPGEDWAARERFWINRIRELGYELLNLTAGGEGLPGLPRSPEVRRRIAAGLRTGATFGCERCGQEFWRKRSEIQKGNNRFCSRDCSNARHKPMESRDA
jgi:hypothetical protein